MLPVMADLRSPDGEDPRWAEAVGIANIPTLLTVLVQMTGDLRWLRDPYRPSRTRGLGDNDSGGLPDRVQAEIRQAALDAILAWRAGRPLAIPEPSDELLVEMMSVSLGETVALEYAPMIAHELQTAAPVEPSKADGIGAVVVGDDGRPLAQPVAGRRRPDDASRSAAKPPPGFRALIVGAGVSGICAAVRLAEIGVDYTILERNQRVGGTWWDNRYPGCGVDTPNHLYSFSFAKNDWSRYFALRDELHQYLERVATDHGVRDRIRFGIEVTSASYDAGIQGWVVEAVAADGARQTFTADILITAVGAFNKPKMPNVKGASTFPGPVAHTARWPSDGLDLEGKRVAVIGSGASAMQLVPAIAPKVGSMVVFQRSPQWAAPFEKFGMAVPEPIRFLLRELPLYYAWYRLRLSWAFNDRIHPALQKDPAWPHPERAVNAINDGHRRYYTRYIVDELGDRQDLLPKVLPGYPPFGKRMLLDNGWFRTMTRPNVELVTEGVAEIDGDRIITSSGAEYRAEVLIWATGFDVVRFLAPMEIRGRSGRPLSEVWNGDDARAFLGLTVPDFPNFFCLYGPNTQFGHGGSLITVMERQTHYLVSLLTQMFERGLAVVEVRQEVHDDYNRRVDEAHERMVWTHPGMDTYYRNSKGRVVVNNPFRIVEYFEMTRSADPGDYRVEPAAVHSR